MKANEMTTYYKFLGANRKTSNTDYQWPEPGEWTPAIKGELVACRNGYHLCRPQDLVHWINSDLWECEVKGKIIESNNKIVARRARLVRHVDAWNERTQRLFACDCAERALNLVGNPDPRSVESVRVARLYAVGDATKNQLDAAWADARAAAGAAAWADARAAAGDAAGDAARDAAGDAARDAARAAAWAAAGDAAWAAAWAAARAAAWAAAWDAARAVAWDAARAAARAAAWAAARAAAWAWQSERIMFYISQPDGAR